jgi:ABC-type molybdate transport system permease subunit
MLPIVLPPCGIGIYLSGRIGVKASIFLVKLEINIHI